MLTDGKGTLAEQEASKARDKEKFAATAAAAAAEKAQLSDMREFTDAAGNVWKYSTHSGSGTVHIFGCTSDAQDLEIPAEIEGAPVSTLHSGAIANMPALKSICVPACVSSIEKYAFKGCPNLLQVNAACEANSYSPTWFDASRKIEEMALPNGAKELKPNVFDLPLKKLRIGRDTEVLTPGMFGRSKLESIEIAPENPHLKTDGTGIYSKDGSVFVALAKPVKEYTVAPGTRELGKKAFSTFSCLEQVHLPCSLEVIDEFCFSRTSVAEFKAPANCREIRNNAFINCRHLESAELNDKLEVIGDEAFAVTKISELHLPKSLKFMGNRVAISTNCTFSGNDATFTIHQDCEHLKLDAQGCLYAIEEGEACGAGDGAASPKNMTLMRYLDTSVTHVEVAPGTTEIGEAAFFKHPNLQSVVLPEGVRIIGKCAFKDCEALTHVEVPNTLERIENEAFVNTRIDGIRVPAALEHIGAMALVSAGAFRAEDAPSIQKIEVDPQNKKFYKAGSLLCEHLEGGEDQVVVRDTTDHVVKFPRSVTTILPYALGGATDIEELYVSDTIQTIHMRGFSFDCHIPKVYVHIDTPIEGHSDFFFAFPNNMRGKRQLGNAFRTMKSVNVQAVYYCYDLTITNSGSFGTYGKNDSDLYYQMGLIFARLDDPIFMSNVTRETIDKIFLFNIEELGRLFTMFADTHAIDEMQKHGYVRENNAAHLLSGAFIACEDAQHKVENARDALEVVEARLDKLEGELAAAQAAAGVAGCGNDDAEGAGEAAGANGAEGSSNAEDAEDAAKKLEQAKKAVESTRARAEKRRGVLSDAEELTTNTTKVRDYIFALCERDFSLSKENLKAQVEAIKQEKEEARKNEPANKRSRGAAGVSAGAAAAAKGGAADITPDDSSDSNKYEHYSAANDPALQKAIWGVR